CGSLVTCVFHSKTGNGKFITCRWVEFHNFTGTVDERVGNWVERQVACDGNGRDHFRGSYKSIGIGVAVGPFSEVSVERMHDGVFLLFFGTHTSPHTNAG